MKNKIFILLAAAIFGISSYGFAQTKMTLRQCIETGLANNLMCCAASCRCKAIK